MNNELRTTNYQLNTSDERQATCDEFALFCAFYADFCAFCASLWLKRTVFSQLLNKAISMALWTKASLFSYITPSFRPQMAIYASRFTRYELSSLLEQSLPRTPSRLKQISVNLRNLRLKNSCLYSLFFCTFLWLKNPFNQRNPRYEIRSTKGYVRNYKLFMQNEPKFRKVK